MPFGINPDCPCCKDNLHHCKRCWDKYHNGKKHKDYEEPEYFGQSFWDDKLEKKMAKEGMPIKHIIKENKNRKYIEGEYPH